MHWTKTDNTTNNNLFATHNYQVEYVHTILETNNNLFATYNYQVEYIHTILEHFKQSRITSAGLNGQ